ncbi:MAG: 30S ribosomal protein S4e [Candidatus Aenigmarchaeota archaeon]|nr:30S ribosomal protein S4e [Candidatus Aenigmarchaeota archaeon]
MTILKRLAAPKLWKTPRKKKKFIVSPRPGAHLKEYSIPLGIILRDYLKVAETLGEAKKILTSKIVKVNDHIRTDYKFSVGFMDVLEVGNKAYRVVPTSHGLELKEIKDKDIKLSKVLNKTTVKGGKIQLNLHEGWNLLYDSKDIKTGDVLVIDLKTKKIKDVLKFEEGSLALITGGSNIGKIGKIEKIKIIRSPRPNMVVLSVNGAKVAVPSHYVFVVGKDKPVIEL